MSTALLFFLAGPTGASAQQPANPPTADPAPVSAPPAPPVPTELQRLAVLSAAKDVQIARMAAEIARLTAALTEQRYALQVKPLERPGFELEVDLQQNTVTYRPAPTVDRKDGTP